MYISAYCANIFFHAQNPLLIILVIIADKYYTPIREIVFTSFSPASAGSNTCCIIVTIIIS